MRCNKCNKRIYVYRNQGNRNIKIYYCKKCKNTQIVHDADLDEFI